MTAIAIIPTALANKVRYYALVRKCTFLARSNSKNGARKVKHTYIDGSEEIQACPSLLTEAFPTPSSVALTQDTLSGPCKMNLKGINMHIRAFK